VPWGRAECNQWKQRRRNVVAALKNADHGERLGKGGGCRTFSFCRP
jgi:hypothetical protein